MGCRENCNEFSFYITTNSFMRSASVKRYVPWKRSMSSEIFGFSQERCWRFNYSRTIGCPFG